MLHFKSQKEMDSFFNMCGRAKVFDRNRKEVKPKYQHTEQTVKVELFEFNKDGEK